MECKHFSHPHYLNFQQLQPGPEIQCSGCKLPATGPIYTCWQCNFFLHEQCYKASRALNHNSHPSHPLTLIPYPTYPSNSFNCNSCNQTGTGFSFSCSNCDFDIHVHCAYNPQTTPNESSYPFGPTQNFSLPNSQFPFPPPTSTHESYPNFPTPNFNAQNQNHYIPQSANHEALFNNPPHVHVHVQHPNATVPSFNAQMGHENAIHVPNFQHPLPNQTPPSFNSPMVPQPIVHQSFQNMSDPQNPQPYETMPPNFNIHTGTETGTHGSNLQQYPLPNQTPSSYIPPMAPNQPNVHQPFQNIPNPAYELVPSFNAQMRLEATEMPSNANKPINVSTSGENQQKLQGVKHFSHHHALLFSQIKKQDGIICSGCEQKVSGSAYTCTVSNCNFNLHNSCFGLPREIKKHKSHPEHSLSLLSIPPYKEHRQFECSACLERGGAFVYNCSICNFDLHVECAFLPETVDREDHEHSLALLYSSPYKKVKKDDPDIISICDVCRNTVDQSCWIYYCQDCDFGTHLGCVTAQQCPEEDPFDTALAILLRAKGRKACLELI